VVVAFALEAEGAERPPRRRHIGADGGEPLGEAVARRIGLGKRAKLRVDLNRSHPGIRDARQKTKPGDTDARAHVEHALAPARRNRSRKQHGIAPRPMAAARLNHADAPAEKFVGAGCGGAARAGLRRFHRRQ
jgi:hypothetical protein